MQIFLELQRIILCYPDKPGAPKDLVAKEVFADHCTLAWKPPTDDGGAELSGE